MTDSEVVWRFPLRLAHIMDGYVPLRPRIADELRAALQGTAATVRFELAHPGEELDESEAVQDTVSDLSDEQGRLTGIKWPLSFFPGLELLVQWPRHGRVVRATTALMETPVTVDGLTIGHGYSKDVFTRENAPGSTREEDSPIGLDGRGLVMRAVRRCGLLTVDGHALLDRSGLPTAVFGQPPAAWQTVALEAAVEELLATDRLYPARGSRDAYGHPHYPPRASEPEIPLIGYAPNAVPTPRAVSVDPDRASGWHSTTHLVHGFVRRLRPGSSPSETQRAAYRQHCQRLGKADGWELPSGYTFVTDHTRTR
ncbi:hypothetical protein ACIRRH_18175 [Kitasatospora sp. NPDC101235]|uniref:hypothetical protein n=1 Tax=Kitasatospora sp. NPDC101235 TaxID=3364101 RepID=UPI00382A6C7F